MSNVFPGGAQDIHSHLYILQGFETYSLNEVEFADLFYLFIIQKNYE